MRNKADAIRATLASQVTQPRYFAFLQAGVNLLNQPLLCIRWQPWLITRHRKPTNRSERYDPDSA